MDADALGRMNGTAPTTEEDVLQWLAHEYGLPFTRLENVEPDRSILSRFPARILLREEMLPLREENGHVEVALSRLFAAPGLDSLKAFTDLKLQPILAPSAAVQREIKKASRRRRGHAQPARTGGRFPGSSRTTARTTAISTRPPRTRASSASSTRSSATRFRCARRTSTSSRSSTNCASATASTVCCKRCRCPRRSSGSNPRLSRASKFSPTSTSPRNASRRTGASRSASRARTWTSACR